MDSIETSRLLLRPFTSEDGSKFYTVVGNDPDMTWEGEAWSYEKTMEWLNIRIKHYEDHGFGVWAIVDKISGEMIGEAGLQILKEANEVELIVFIAKHWWRKGIGFEACSASLNYGYMELNILKIIAVTRVHNISAQRLMEKLGFQRKHEGSAYGRKVFYYDLLNSEFVEKLDNYRVLYSK